MRMSKIPSALIVSLLAVTPFLISGAAADRDPSQAVGEICARVLHVREGTVEFDTCKSSLLQNARAADLHNAVMPVGAVRMSSTPFIESIPEERHHREATACAQLGLDGGAYAQCVVDLSLAMDGVTNPAG